MTTFSFSPTKALPCCRLIRAYSDALMPLKYPEKVHEVLEVVSRHCELVKLMGKEKIKWDLSKSCCYIAVSPEQSEAVIAEIAKTLAAYGAEHNDNRLLFHLSAILSHNAELTQLADRSQIFLSQLREGEKKFGGVPDTPMTKDPQTTNTLGAGELLQAHPLLNKPQFDGIDPKSNPNPVQNPEAVENVKQLQNRLQYQKQLQHTLGATPTAIDRPRPI